MKEEKTTPDYLFEVSWEVCNMVGGIYTVLSTKAKTLQKLYKDKTIFIGPDIWKERECPFFTEGPASLLKDWKKQAEEKDGLKVRVGRWNIPGKPIVILVDFSMYYSQKDQLYADVWNWYKVDSLHAYGDYDEACMFAYASARVIESFYRYTDGEKLNIIAHFNEWTTGMGLLYLKHTLPNIATLFTTHATSIGRSIAGNNKPLYDYLEGYNGDQMAGELNMEAKHSLEKQAAIYSDCFTTVSDITACECAQLLDKTPDVVTPNGFEENFVPKGKAFLEKRETARQLFLKTAAALCGYEPDKDAFLIATSGRYEYKNKGIDLFIEALRKLRDEDRLHREIIAFILVPAYVDSARPDLLDRINGKKVAKTPLNDPLITHRLHNYYEDRVMRHLHAAGFTNAPTEKVKIIFIPSYLTGYDGLLNLPYYDLLIGLDATVFPSYYEPWGYTPLESIAFGVPTITTDLSGFGLWAKKAGAGNNGNDGVTVLHRTDSNFNEVATGIAHTVKALSEKLPLEKTAIDKAARQLAKQADWAHFISYYQQAFDLALQKAKK